MYLSNITLSKFISLSICWLISVIFMLWFIKKFDKTTEPRFTLIFIMLFCSVMLMIIINNLINILINIFDFIKNIFI